MPTVSLETGFTVHVGSPANNEYARCTIKIDGINTDLPLDPQLESTRVAIEKLWPEMYKLLDKAAEEAVGIKIIRKKDITG